MGCVIVEEGLKETFNLVFDSGAILKDKRLPDHRARAVTNPVTGHRFSAGFVPGRGQCLG